MIIILFPIFIYQLIIENRLFKNFSRRNFLFIGVLSGVSSIFCMTFPIVLSDGFLLDLRWIPYAIAILYGGFYSWIPAFVMILGYRLYIGGSAVYTSFPIAIVFALAVFLIRKQFHVLNRNKKMMYGGVIGGVSFLLVIVTFYIFLEMNDDVTNVDSYEVVFYLKAYFLSVIAMAISIFLIENMIENKKMHAEIQRSEKLTVISELAASIAHEVRNPLTVVRGFIQLLSKSVDEKNQQYIKMVINELDRAESIISDYLNLARPHNDRIEPIEVCNHLNSIVDIMSPYALMKNIELRLDCEKGIRIQGDKDKFKQIIMNLIKNSIEAIVLRGSIAVQAFRSDDRVIITITDSGEGMTQEQLQRVGNPFYSTKENGTGLGLMVTFQLIESMGGKLEIFSELGKGTEARIGLPAVRVGCETEQTSRYETNIGGV
ncbi:sensor histidine kinase [Fodinisporobacter ferrooxydans]|uniref:histidine kinase n=1 Tax=Fodinisporobacter ferrooxydans TaxID=2901836 RepID=A0ABY4CUB1_9BACL|nr:sensor histidine kinase [Alicyclobacillaceae bacterium MYW30-H2]